MVYCGKLTFWQVFWKAKASSFVLVQKALFYRRSIGQCAANSFVLAAGGRGLRPRPAVGLGAPQSIVRRPVGASHLPLASISQVNDCTYANFTPAIRGCMVDNIFSNFSHRCPRTFHFSKLFFNNSFLVLPWWSNDLENFMENLLPSAIDQHPVCRNTAPSSVPSTHTTSVARCLNWCPTFISNTKPQQQPLNLRLKRSIAYKATHKATQARRTTITTELEQLAPLRTTTKLKWNKAAPFWDQQPQTTNNDKQTNYMKPRGEPRLTSLGPASNLGPGPRSLQSAGVHVNSDLANSSCWGKIRDAKH